MGTPGAILTAGTGLILYSLVQSCRLQGIDAFAYLRAVIRRLHEVPMSRIGELTPRGWRLAKEQE